MNYVWRALTLTIWILMAMQPTTQARSVANDEKAVETLDIEYQVAVKQNDVATSAAKHTAKVFLASADAGTTPVIAASVLIISTPQNDRLD